MESEAIYFKIILTDAFHIFFLKTCANDVTGLLIFYFHHLIFQEPNAPFCMSPAHVKYIFLYERFNLNMKFVLKLASRNKLEQLNDLSPIWTGCVLQILLSRLPFIIFYIFLA